MEGLWQDLRFGVRTLRRSPLTAALALLTLALGIGANTAIWSVVDHVLLRPLPYPHPDQLVAAISSAPARGFPRFGVSAPDFFDWRAGSRTFAGLAAYLQQSYNLSGAGTAETLSGAAASADLFRVLGVAPQLGRFFQPDDDRPGAGRVAVLSYALWRSHFGGSAAVIGRTVELQGLARTVVGVAPPAAEAAWPGGGIAVWVPLAVDYGANRGSRYLKVLGRLRAGVPLGQARAEMAALAARLERQYPDTNTGWSVELQPWQALLVERIRPALVTLQVAVWLVLLIACANVGSLLLARLAGREQELAVRAALGAGRARLARQVLAESLVLFVAGGAAGLALAAAATRALAALEADAMPRAGAAAAGLDPRMLAYALVLTLATGVAVGLAPALAGGGGGAVQGALRAGGRGVAAGGRAWRLRSVLVLAEVALALALLVGAGLLLRSFAHLRAVDPGFAAPGVVTLSVTLPTAQYPAAQPARRLGFQERALARLRALPGVTAAATVYPLPFSGSDAVDGFRIDGRPQPPPGEGPSAASSVVSPGYFQAMGIPVLRGRPFAEQDDANGLRVVVISRLLAGRYWPRADPLGQRITFEDGSGATAGDTWWTVVGLVGDVEAATLGGELQGAVYRCMLQRPVSRLSFVIRSATALGPQAAAVRQALRDVDDNLPLDRLAPLGDLVDASMAERRVRTWLLVAFGAMSLLLAGVGIYGLISDSVTRRTREIGIRVALGATRAGVRLLVLRQGMGLVAAGLALGLAGAWFAVRLLEGQLYAVSARDPLTFVAVPLLLAAVALLANWLPARRALAVDPADALRDG